MDSYPRINVTLAERLGEANWKRYLRVAAMSNDAESVGDDSESEDTDDEGDRVGDLPDFTETTKSSADPSSIFSSAGRQTNTTGTSVSNNAFDFAFPVSRKRRIGKGIKSQATFTSFVTNDLGERGWLKLPAMPKAVESGKSFRCTVCGDKQKDIINQTEWKKHVFTDLKPYICTFQDCKRGIHSFPTRKAWADHEFSVHRTTKIWICNDCAARFSERTKYREHAYSSHGNVLMRNQLEALVNSAEKRIDISEENVCPFYFELLGNQSRTFTMHVSRHMEEVALAILPRETAFEDDRGSAGSSIDSSGLKDMPGLLQGPSFSQASAPPLAPSAFGSIAVPQNWRDRLPRDPNFSSLGAGGPPQLPLIQTFAPLYSQPPTPIDKGALQDNDFKTSFPPLRPVFGLSLEDLFKRDGSAIPSVVYQCIQAVDLYGLEVEGIYRLSGSSAHVSKLQSIFDDGRNTL